MPPEARPAADLQDAVALHPDWNRDDHFLTVLARNARDHPDEVAMRERGRGIWQEYTWTDYLEEVVAFAAGLEPYGVTPGRNVMVIGDNRPALYFGMVGVNALRAVPSPAFSETPPAELARQMEREEVRFALAEDQEQVDKLFQVREEHGVEVDLIVYDDPRGLAGNEPEGVVAYTRIVAEGHRRLAENPELRDELIARPSAHDIAVLLHSSGTSGEPKGVPLRHGHILSGVRNASQAGHFHEGEVHMAYLPMAWVGDYIFSVGAALALRFSVNIPERQETAVHDLREIAPTLYFSSPRAWSNMLTRIQVGMDESTRFKRWLYEHFMPFAVELERRRLEGKEPTFVERLRRAMGEILVYGPIKDRLGLSRMKRPYTAGEAIGEDVFLFFRALGLDLRQFYGQTENCALCAAQEPGEIMLHTVGRPFPGVEVKIDDDGEILVRAENIFDGYYGDPEATAEALQDGWLHTGDAGYMEDDGQVVVLGRVAEVVYTAGGERFIPTYIENRIKFSQYVKDVCVLGQDREFLTAIVSIDIQAAGHWSEERGVAYTSFADLSQKPQVYELVEGVIQGVNQVLPEPLRIRRFVNLHKEFDPDDGEVTRTRKLRRSVIDENYAPIIEALYEGRDAIDFEAAITYETGESGVIKRTLAIRDLPDAAGSSSTGNETGL